MDPQSHAEHLAHLERLLEHQREVGDRLKQMVAEHDARRAATSPMPQGTPPPPLDPKAFDTTIAQVRRMAQKDVHPTWMHAAYADLAGRLARVEDLLEDLEASMSLLHTKMETL